LKKYKYIANNVSGKRIKGEMTADNSEEFLARLSAQNLYCLDYQEINLDAAAPTTIYKLKTKEIVVFCRQFGTMLESGIQITKIFDILSSQETKPKLKNIYYSIYENIQKGMGLSAAMLRQGNAFPPLLINMIQAGELSGTLDNIMAKMSEHYASELKLHNKVKATMIYPIILLIVSLLVVIILFTFVLPTMFSIFGDTDLPLATKIVMGISDFLVKDWYVPILVVLMVILLFKTLLKVPAFKYGIDKLKVSMPLFGKLLTTIYTARFANSMATLYSSGIPIMQTVDVSGTLLNNNYYSSKIALILEDIGSGRSLASSMEKTHLFDSMFYSIVYIGEESGNLEKIMLSTAAYYNEEAQNALTRLVSMLEPIMIVILAVIVGFIIVSVITPIYNMYSNVY